MCIPTRAGIFTSPREFGADGPLIRNTAAATSVQGLLPHATHLGVERLDAAVEDLGRARVLGHILDGEARVADGLGGAARGEELHALPRQEGGQLHQARLVGDGEEGALDRPQVRLRALHRRDLCVFEGFEGGDRDWKVSTGPARGQSSIRGTYGRKIARALGMSSRASLTTCAMLTCDGRPLLGCDGAEKTVVGCGEMPRSTRRGGRGAHALALAASRSSSSARSRRATWCERALAEAATVEAPLCCRGPDRKTHDWTHIQKGGRVTRRIVPPASQRAAETSDHTRFCSSSAQLQSQVGGQSAPWILTEIESAGAGRLPRLRPPAPFESPRTKARPSPGAKPP